MVTLNQIHETLALAVDFFFRCSKKNSSNIQQPVQHSAIVHLIVLVQSAWISFFRHSFFQFIAFSAVLNSALTSFYPAHRVFIESSPSVTSPRCQLLSLHFQSSISLWARTTKNTDWSNGALARLFARLLALHYLLCLRTPLRSLARSLWSLVGQ